jgi:hypothetical protein
MGYVGKVRLTEMMMSARMARRKDHACNGSMSCSGVRAAKILGLGVSGCAGIIVLLITIIFIGFCGPN